MNIRYYTVYIGMIVFFNSCFFGGQPDLHPEYPDISSLKDTIGFPLQLLPVNNENLLPTDYKGFPVFDARMLRGTLYYYTPMTTEIKKKYVIYPDTDTGGIEHGGAYYNERGELQFKFDAEDFVSGTRDISDLLGARVLDGTTREGNFVFYTAKRADRKYLIYDFQKNRIVDTIKKIYYEDMEQAVGDSLKRVITVEFGLPLPVVVEYPDREAYPNDSIGTAQYYKDKDEYFHKAQEIATEYLHGFVNSNPGSVYKIDDNTYVDIKRKVALVFYTLQVKEQIDDLPPFLQDYPEPQYPPKPGDLFVLHQDGYINKFNTLTGGRGGIGTKEHHLYYYSLVYNKTDTIRFKSYQTWSLHSYSRKGDKYILILNPYVNRHTFFEYTPPSN